MNKKSDITKILFSTFILIQVALTVLVFIFEKNRYSYVNVFRYSSIVLCFIVSCFSFKSKHNHYLICGLAFTLVADYFLLLKNNNYTIGILFFIVVQSMYFLYIHPKHWKISLVLRIGVSGVIFLVAFFALNVNDASAYVAIFYFTNLVMNTIDSYLNLDKQLILMAIGLTLFIGCDTFVGILNLKNFVKIDSEFFNMLVKNSVLILWLFYIPSQTLISLSSFYRKENK